MLNISNNSVLREVNTTKLNSYQLTFLPKANRMFTWWLTGFLLLILIVFFLPWTQNIQAKGKVTTLLPEQRPQDVVTAIAGRIEKWYVREGDLVQAGDTLAFLSEVKAEYFDPNLVQRTSNQVTAKEGSINNYQQKADALDNQVSALRQELQLKKVQLENKIQQSKAKLESQRALVEQAEIDAEIADFQFRRTDTLYQKGIKSLNDLEGKRLKRQETKAKLTLAKNKLLESENQLNISELAFRAIDNEYNNKIAKSHSDKFATLSTLNEAKGSLNKLQSQYESYNRRNALYYVIAPQTGYITKTVKSGIGEIVKENETLLTIVPYERELAVEMYIKPMDLPLIGIGTEVRIVFDGWQAFIISGWSDFSVGTFTGEIAAIDFIPNNDSKYRVMVKWKESAEPFPELLRIGSGAQGIALLEDVPVWYEIWRQLNGFPADFYDSDIKKNETKFKPPVKAVAK